MELALICVRQVAALFVMIFAGFVCVRTGVVAIDAKKAFSNLLLWSHGCMLLDRGENGDTAFAILDASAACHMPDVLEMPYRPPLFGADDAAAFPVRLGGPTCLSGDVIGDYRFAAPLREGDLLCFGDMAIYTTCKNNTFNGMPLPAIWLRAADGRFTCLRRFGYGDFKTRLGALR